jgi:hypothetical protein
MVANPIVSQQQQQQQQIKPEETLSKNEWKTEVDNLKTEIDNTKELLLNLQSFTMQTNQKLVDVVFNESMSMSMSMPSSMQASMQAFMSGNENHSLSNLPNLNFISIENMNMNDLNDSLSQSVVELDEDNGNLPNLKEIIEKELENA